ncbi:Permease of the drug/metabolite transporter (DMT) superfamily [Bosea sp. 62]|nr:Permease of the drug/metabolite transporter (DMT) superfamily [Bosea sp. 46]CAD5250467.1 Permease of the drug/metabolite transporter (DMT) superfamily [Bosea sp. 21B]CAD5264219.1 Permease of the drug/metabolite transporter (DMT) superfamily [Bosea sp. 7B]VVT44132.1 Permease of the drug/metabolite transporter (DMT) superfamily [Bosea sp. EC-HK365B]VXB12579.1 Permease of the drug/metabolite transporter (DMT) superfamily [Bosea sp. 29B]VXB79438.1 Permease of the drug/metabolite transporter (DM
MQGYAGLRAIGTSVLQQPASFPQRVWANAYLLLVMTTLLWAGNAVASRLAVGEIAPMTLTALRWVFVCAVMPYLFRRGLREHWPALKANWLKVVLLGAFGFTAFNTLMYIAAYSTTAINIGILQGSIPVFVLLGAFFAFRTPIGVLQGLGVAVTIIGVLVTASRGDWHVLSQLSFVPGDLWMMIACIFYAGYTVGIRTRPPMPGLIFFTAMAIVACLVSLPLLCVEIAAGKAYWPTPKGWLILAFVVIGPSILSQLFFMRAIELIGPGRAGVFVNLVPVFAPLLAVAILGEQLALYHGLALALVLGGIWIAERRLR